MPNDEFTLDGEHETRNGWLYTFTLIQGSQTHHHELTLSWVDHEHLVGGTIAPEYLAKAIFELAVTYFGEQLPSKFDASSLRRRVDDFDDRVRARIQAPL
ncbi:MAG: hypothetical protein JJ916_03920 [Phycisphaerales bacterium]|nr:hypothetical protein [Phycisphaerales bacterium]